MNLAVTQNSRAFDARNDEELVASAQAGDERSVRAIIQRYNKRIFRVARGVVRSDAEAEDIVQETYVRAFTHLDSFRGESLFSTWLTRIALNEALGRVRRGRSMVDLAELESDRNSSERSVIMFPTALRPENPETEAGREQVRGLLEDEVDKLPDLFRLVFVLRDIQGLSTDETAAYLSIRSETVKTRLHRARRLLRLSIERTMSAGFSDLFPFDGARCAHMGERVVSRLRQHANNRHD